MALVLSGSIDISGSMTATTIVVSSPGAAGMVSSSAQIGELVPLMQSTSSINNLTGSLITTSSNNVIAIDGLNTYTASIKGATIVSSSQQVQNYFTFAQTSSANTFYGNQSIRGNVNINGGNSVRFYESTNTNYWDAYTYTDNTLRVNYKGAGNDEIILYNDGGINFNGAVTASGNVSVGASSFTSPGGADKFIGVFSGQDSSIILQDAVETWEMYMNDDLFFTTGSTSPKSVLTLKRVTGNVEVNEGNLVIGKAGKGIDFSITSNGSGTTTSEILNDYEEGTWTPTLTSDTSPSGVAYSGRFGKYTKIGRVVHVEFVIGLTSKGTGTGDSFISGLPFTVANDMGSGEPACVNISLCQGLSTSVYVVTGWANNASTDIALRKMTAAGTTYPGSYMNTTDISDSLYIQGNVTYHV